MDEIAEIMMELPVKNECFMLKSGRLNVSAAVWRGIADTADGLGPVRFSLIFH